MCSAALLTGCSASPVIDLGEAADWASRVQSEASDGPGIAGAATLTTAPDAEDDDSDSDDDRGGVTIAFPKRVTLEAAEARCYGGTTADVDVAASQRDGDSIAVHTFSGTLPCDEAPHRIDVDLPVDSVHVSGRSDVATYVYVELHEELTTD